MKISTLRLLLAALSVAAGVSLSAQHAHAFGTVIPGGGNGLPGNTQSMAGNGSQSVAVLLDAGRSYACTVKAPSGGHVLSIDTAVFNSSGVEIDNTANAVALRGAVTPGSQGSTSNADVADNRIVITPVTADAYRFVINNGSASATDAAFECMETTLYGGYNTNANPFNFLELTNITNATINGTVRGFNFDGTQTVGVSFSIPANNRFDVDVHTAAGANVYGVLIVSHDGPLGALQGFVSQYNGPVSALVLQASTPLSTREQTF